MWPLGNPVLSNYITKFPELYSNTRTMTLAVNTEPGRLDPRAIRHVHRPADLLPFTASHESDRTAVMTQLRRQGV